MRNLIFHFQHLIQYQQNFVYNRKKLRCIKVQKILNCCMKWFAILVLVKDTAMNGIIMLQQPQVKRIRKLLSIGKNCRQVLIAPASLFSFRFNT